jgi:hypothetical protein
MMTPGSSKAGDIVVLVEDAGVDRKLGHGWVVEGIEGPREGEISAAPDTDLAPLESPKANH